MKKIELFILTIIALVAVAVRLYAVNNPVADWHSWRQSDTAAVARNFIKFGIDPLRPRFDDLSNIPSGHDNPMGWRMVEFPLYQLASVLGKGVAPQVSIEVWLRIVSIAASVGTGVLLTLLVARVTTPLVGILAGFIYFVLPYSVFYGRAILPDTFMVFWAVLSLYLLTLKKETHWILFISSCVSAALALLVKPMAVFLLLPSVYLLYRNFSFSKIFFIRLLVYSFISLFPLYLWRQWITQYPEGIPVYSWLFNEGNIRFKGAWFYWLFAKRLGEIILGYWGLVPFALGMLAKPSKSEGWVFRWWAIGAISYFVIIARGNVQHDYYQILIIPVVSVYLAKGFSFLLTNSVFSKLIAYPLSLIMLLFMLAFSWYTVRSYYWINREEIIELGRQADELLPKDAKVIAPYNGDTTFLYQTNRQGWPIGFDIDKKIALGATHYVTLSPTDSDLETKDLAQKYTVIIRNEKYAIIDLTKPR